MHSTLISTSHLAQHLDDPQFAIVDCRFILADPGQGEKDYLQAHIPGAVYAHLDRDLSSRIIPGETGRHPWPSVEQAAGFLSRLGIDESVQVVAYDDAGGALAAVRLWWTLRWLGHEAAAVLDGGWSRWVDEGRPTKSGSEHRQPRQFKPRMRAELLVDAAQVERIRQDQNYRLIDVRAPERYRGEVEPIDTVAGHIPGAVNSPYLDNLDISGHFIPPDELRVHYESILGDVPPQNAIFYCGSGVTSIHSLLAMLHAGFGEGRLYAGSWSEWITDPDRPVATK